MTSGASDTALLLQRWHRGDREALNALLERNLPWLGTYVHRRLSPALRRRAETDDFIQAVVVQFLTYAPRFVVASRAQFRALLARVVENDLRDEQDRYATQRRTLAEHRPLSTDSVYVLGRRGERVRRPSEIAELREWEGWVRLAQEFITPNDRELIVSHEIDGVTFPQLASRLGISEDAARMRFNRALKRLAQTVELLQAGKIARALKSTGAKDEA